jgi:hypothetical protein
MFLFLAGREGEELVMVDADASEQHAAAADTEKNARLPRASSTTLPFIPPPASSESTMT